MLIYNVALGAKTKKAIRFIECSLDSTNTDELIITLSTVSHPSFSSYFEIILLPLPGSAMCNGLI